MTDMRGNGWGRVLATVAVVALTVVGGVLVVRVNPPQPVPDADRQVVPTGATSSVTVKTFLAGPTPTGPKLFPGVTSVLAAPGQRLQAAMQATVVGTGADPDHRSAFPQGTSVLVKKTSTGQTLIDLRGVDADTDNGEFASLAADALVRAAAANGAPLDYVVAVNGRPISSFSGVPITPGRFDEDTLAPVWITSPVQDDVVGTGFAITGQAITPDGLLHWEALDDQDVIIADGTATLSAADDRVQFSIQVQLPSGSYRVRVFGALLEPPTVEKPETQFNSDDKLIRVR